MSRIVVTGACGALGAAVTKYLAEVGHQVAGVDLAPGPPPESATLFCGGVDLADSASVAAAIAQITTSFDGIDALVNIAGGFLWETLEDGDIANWDRMYQMNLRTAVIASRAAITHLLATQGAIVNVGAAAALQPAVGMGPYAASKSGVRALTESLADELRGRGVRVNALLPTIIDTPANRRDMPEADTTGWVRPEAAARVIAFLISPQAGAITGAAIPLSLAG